MLSASCILGRSRFPLQSALNTNTPARILSHWALHQTLAIYALAPNEILDPLAMLKCSLCAPGCQTRENAHSHKIDSIKEHIGIVTRARVAFDDVGFRFSAQQVWSSMMRVLRQHVATHLPLNGLRGCPLVLQSENAVTERRLTPCLVWRVSLRPRGRLDACVCGSPDTLSSGRRHM